jgi:gas vesicle protein
MGDTVEALGHKTDVTGRAKDAVSGKVESVKSSITGATPDGDQVAQGARRAAGLAQENPLGLALGAVAVGFVAGMVIPSTKVEDEHIGEMADQLKDKAKEAGQEVVERGKDVAQQAAESARDTAQEAGREHAEEMRDGGDGDTSSEEHGTRDPARL